MTWSTKNSPEEQAILTHAYASIAKELDATLAPVGLVWDQLRTKEQFEFYSRDGSHPSPEGSYLAATTLLATMLDVDPTGLSANISGKKLSSRGVPSMESQPLVDIPTDNAKEIQAASWAVVQALQKQGGYPEVEQPKPSYEIPVLAKGEQIDKKNIEGTWYGTSSYGFNYLGLILDVAFVKDIPEVSLSYYSPDREDRMTVQEAKIEEDQLKLTIYDSLRTLTTQVDFSLTNGQFSGLSTSIGARLLQYRHWELSREKVQNDIDLEAVGKLIHTFQDEAQKEGFVKAAIKHYAAYSDLIGKDYLPEERYLNAEGYNLMREKKLKDALDLFELAMTLYPESVNTYDSYGEGLIAAGQKEKALKIYTKGYELAKKTNYEDLAYIEGNMRKLEEELK